MCQTTNPVFTTEPASAKPGIGTRVGAFLGAIFAAALTVLGAVAGAVVRNAGTALGAIISFVAVIAYETLVACRYFVLAAVAVMALLWFWGQGSRELGSRPPQVGFFETLGGRTEEHGGIKAYQTFWGKTYVGLPYLGWREATEAEKAAK